MVVANFEKYKKDLDALISKGGLLEFDMIRLCDPESLSEMLKPHAQGKEKELIAKLPSFTSEYQTWYSEARVLIKQLIPDRLEDFVRHYEKPKSRKAITYENYVIEDFLQGLQVMRGAHQEKVVGRDAAFPRFLQQQAILASLKSRFVSSLFDIKQLVQGDVFDSELDAARELLKHKFPRASGAIAGVVLERHLGQVCDHHSVKIAKKSPCIADYNDALKTANVVDIPQWRFIQHLGDLRNLCDHDKKREPTNEQVTDLLDGVAKITKSVF